MDKVFINNLNKMMLPSALRKTHPGNLKIEHECYNDFKLLGIIGIALNSWRVSPILMAYLNADVYELAMGTTKLRHETYIKGFKLAQGREVYYLDNNLNTVRPDNLEWELYDEWSDRIREGLEFISKQNECIAGLVVQAKQILSQLGREVDDSVIRNYLKSQSPTQLKSWAGDPMLFARHLAYTLR